MGESFGEDNRGASGRAELLDHADVGLESSHIPQQPDAAETLERIRSIRGLMVSLVVLVQAFFPCHDFPPRETTWIFLHGSVA
jgi:hypothetical protein